MGNRENARKMSVMVQENSIEFDMYVMDMVLLGRYAHKKLLGETNADDRRIAREALLKVGMEACEDRSYLSLSGGEKQRVLIARALTQQAKMIVLDEPTNHLDVGYQYQIMNILKAQDITVFSAIHDLNIAAYYCDKVILMDKGQIIRYGRPEEVFTPECIKNLFKISAEVTVGKNGKFHIYYDPE